MTTTGPATVMLLTAAAQPGGGAEAAMGHMARLFRADRYRAIMAAPEASALLAQWKGLGLQTAGTPPVRRLRSPGDAKRAIRGIRDVLLRNRVDILHTNGVAAHLHGGLAARGCSCAVVSHVRDVVDRSWTANGLLHRLSLLVPRDATIAASKAVADSLGRVRSEVMPDLVETAIVPPVDRPGLLVVWCGRLQRWKGCHLFLRAARQVLAARPDTRFAVVGGTVFGLDPEYADEMRVLAAELGITHAVEFTGHVSDARPWLRASALLVHSSERPDPFGMVTAEAMIQERPVVTFAQGGASDNIVPGETGLLVPPHDVDALAAAIITLLDDPDRRRAMGIAGRTRAVESYGAEPVTRRIEQVYDRVLASRSAHRGAIPQTCHG